MPDRYTRYKLIVNMDYTTKTITFYHLGCDETRFYKYTTRKAIAIARRCRQLWKAGRAFPDFTRGVTWGIDPKGTWEVSGGD